MKVSVIIPVYNGEKTIKRCIESVLNQTLSDIEIIVVNDGSTDATLDILKGFGDSRISVITQDNAGQGMARNTGMDAATGEYIGFVDADDTIEPRMYEEMYNLAKEYNVEVVQCNMMGHFINGRKAALLKPFEGLAEVKDRADYTAMYLVKYIHSYEACNKIYKREFLIENNLKMPDTRKYFSEDILFNMYVVQYMNRIYFTNEPYYNYYEYTTSHMHTGASKRLVQMVDLFDEFLKKTEGKMYNSISFLAAMINLYNVGKCGKTDESYAIANSIGKYIKPGLKAKCGLKRRLYLTAVLFAPVNIKISLSKLLIRN